MKFLRLPVMAIVYFSIATITAEAGLLLAVALKGGLGQERLVQLMAVARGVDLFEMWKELEAAARPIQVAQVSHHEVMRHRRELSLDLGIQEMAAEKGLNDMRQLAKMLEKEKQRFDTLVDDYDRWNLARKEGEADERIQATQQQLLAVTAKQAKQQLTRYLEDPDLLPFVVTNVKAMPLEKRKKILTEFKSDEDTDSLHEVLRRIRLGVPDVQMIRETRERAKQFVTRD